MPTSILTLNWASAVSQAHNLDAQLSPIEGKSREGFVFRIDLQVQIHVPDTHAPKVISMVGTMQNLVNEVLQSAVGNHFRNTLQALEAVRFIETRTAVQQSAFAAISGYLDAYQVETKGVYIQDVEFPAELVQVLTQREVAKQEKATFEEQQRAQTARIEMEQARGTAEMQGQLASARVSVDINRNQATARAEAARGEAAYVQTTAQAEAARVEVMGRAEASRIESVGRAEATKVEALGRAEAVRVEAVGAAEATRTEAIGMAEAKAAEALGLARAEGFEAQKEALGEFATALVAVAGAVADGGITVVPDVLVTGGASAVDGLAASLIRTFAGGVPDGRGARPASVDGSGTPTAGEVPPPPPPPAAALTS